MLKNILISSFVMLLVDYIWLSFIAKDMYQRDLGQFFDIQNGTMKVNYLAASCAYLGIILGIFIFVQPLSHSIYRAWMYGTLYGLIVYGIYDFTNLATIKNWPLKISLIDMAWGGVVCSITNIAAYFTR